MVIAECHPKCKVYEDLPEFRYIVAPADKVKEIDTKIKKKIGESDKRIAQQSVFLFSQNRLLNRGTHVVTQRLLSKSCPRNTRILRMKCCTCISPMWNPFDRDGRCHST